VPARIQRGGRKRVFVAVGEGLKKIVKKTKEKKTFPQKGKGRQIL